MENFGVIKNITEVNNIQLGNTTQMNGKNGSRVGMSQMISALFGGYGSYDGYRIETSEHEFNVLIDNGQSCCESWGYICSEDNTDDYIGKNLIDVQLTDTALNSQRLKDQNIGEYGFDGGGIQFVDFKFDDGSVLQFAVYNEHNGYYGHGILIAKDAEIICQDTL